MTVSHLPPKNQNTIQNRKAMLDRAKETTWADLLGWWLTVCCSLYYHRAGVRKLNNFFNIAEHLNCRKQLQNLLNMEKCGKKQRWLKRKSNQDKLMKQKKIKKKVSLKTKYKKSHKSVLRRIYSRWKKLNNLQNECKIIAWRIFEKVKGEEVPCSKIVF